MKALWSAALVTTLCVGGGCGGDDDLESLATAAAAVRELPRLRDVEVVRMSREEFAARAAAQADAISDEYLAYYADTYGRLGFFDRELDLRPAFAGGWSDWVGATYSPSRHVITLVGEARDDIVVHEYVHALQDQHFGLQSYDDLATSDGFLARRAAVEGDAVLAQARYVMAFERGSELDGVDWAQTMQNYRDYASETLASALYPVVFLDYVSFVYSNGLEYTAANLLRISYEQPVARPPPHYWALEDELFTLRPPDTTQRVLLRDFDLDTADPVRPVGLADIPPALVDRLDVLDWDRLGEWYVYLLFYPLDRVDQLDGRAVAAAWDGDRALFVRDLLDGAVGTIWTSAWDDPETADQVVDALWTLYGYHELKGLPVPIGRADDGELVWIERRGDKVVAAKNLSLDVVEEMVDAAFAGSTTSRRRTHPSLAAALERGDKVE